MQLLDILTFLGHLHPLIVHLPIAFLLLAALLDILSYARKYGHLSEVVPLILLLGFICLARLQKNPSIKRVYTWKTAVKQP